MTSKVKTLLVVLELPVRTMTEDEWTDAWIGSGHDDEESDGPDRVATLDEIAPVDLSEAISGALNSVNNPEVFAGSGLFVHTEDARVLSLAWKDAK